MEPIFKNTYVRNKELAKEIYRFYYFQSAWLVVFNIIISLSFLANLIGAFLGNFDGIAVLVAAPLFWVLQLVLYFRQVNLLIKRDHELHGKDIEVEVIVTDTFIQNTASTGSVNKIEYEKIKGAVQTKNLIILRSKANLLYIFRKDTFEVGTKDDFIVFLKAKGIKVKGK